MANDIPAITQNYLFASIMAQLHTQTKENEQLQEQLHCANEQLNKVNRTLMQKEGVITSLEDDLEHMIDQLTKLKNSGIPSSKSAKWMSKPVPGLNIEPTPSIA